jgi:hypothetical protein
LRFKIQDARDKLARPSTVALAAGVGVLIGKFLLPRPRRRAAASVKATARNNLAAGGLAATVLSRFGWKFLSRMALRLWSSGRRSAMTQPVRSRGVTSSSPAFRAPARTRAVGDTLH